MLGPVLFNLFINELGEGVSVQINDLRLRRFVDKKAQKNKERGQKDNKMPSPWKYECWCIYTIGELVGNAQLALK